jgi:hypothetical protein
LLAFQSLPSEFDGLANGFGFFHASEVSQAIAAGFKLHLGRDFVRERPLTPSPPNLDGAPYKTRVRFSAQ